MILQIILNVFSKIAACALCRPLESLYTKLMKPCPYDTSIVHKGKVMLNGRAPSCKCYYKIATIVNLFVDGALNRILSC